MTRGGSLTRMLLAGVAVLLAVGLVSWLQPELSPARSASLPQSLAPGEPAPVVPRPGPTVVVSLHSPEPGAAAQAAGVDGRRVPVRAANALGEATAPVVMVEYSDFQCIACRKFFTDAEPELIAQYVNAGQVRFVYKHMAAIGQESIWAAQAAECAADQGRFWPYHDELFRQAEAAGGENVGTFAPDRLVEYARALGLDAGRLATCLIGDETLSRVLDDTREGQGLGFAGTPSFLVNDQVLIGAQPFGAYARLLDNLLPGGR